MNLFLGRNNTTLQSQRDEMRVRVGVNYAPQLFVKPDGKDQQLRKEKEEKSQESLWVCGSRAFFPRKLKGTGYDTAIQNKIP